MDAEEFRNDSFQSVFVGTKRRAVGSLFAFEQTLPEIEQANNDVDDVKER